MAKKAPNNTNITHEEAKKIVNQLAAGSNVQEARSIEERLAQGQDIDSARQTVEAIIAGNVPASAPTAQAPINMAGTMFNIDLNPRQPIPVPPYMRNSAGELLNGIDAFEAFYNNNDTFATIMERISVMISLLYQHQISRSNPQKSNLNKIGFNEENIKRLLETVFNPQLIGRQVSADELIRHGSNLSQTFMFNLLFNYDDSVSADQILTKGYQLSRMVSYLPDFMNFNFSEVFAKTVVENPNAELPKAILDTLPAQQAGNAILFDPDFVNFLNLMTRQQNAPAVANPAAPVVPSTTAPSAAAVAAASRPLTQARQSESEEGDIDIQALRNQPDLKEPIRILDGLVSAFSAEPEDYESKLMSGFGDKSRIQLRKDINAKFPAKNLGSALMTYRQGDRHEDILVVIADRFGINSVADFVEKINEISEALKSDYPDAFKDAEADKTKDPFTDIDPNNVAPVNPDDLDDLFNS